MKVDASECMTAISLFTRAVHTFEVVTEEGDDASVLLLADLYSALTKAEKLCGHVKARDVRVALDSIRDQDEPDLQTEATAEYHDYMTTLLVLDLAREMERK